MQTDMLFWDSLVFEGIDDVGVEAATAAFGTVEVTAQGRAAAATCPDPGHLSGRVPDSYRRRLKDLPLGGHELLAQGRSPCNWVGDPTRCCATPAPRAGRTPRDSRPRPSRLDPHKPHPDGRFTEGRASVTQLHRELVAQGAPATYGMVRAYVAALSAVPPDAPPSRRRCGR
ncbi:hypothetical protein [Streptomyces sp. NPDC056154]|uniref:hypothetical protein n=1 Tax=Streptomyces sp. NPDC056154 TaxID=3345729 RepID=UPI0035E2B044